MRKRNLYKDIVNCAILISSILLCLNLYNHYQKQHTLYHFTIQSGQELTAKDTAELQKLSGLVRFEPAAYVPVTLKLEGYTLETTLEGVDLESYPLDWKEAEGTITLGNTAALFFGEGIFQSFSEAHGYHPGKAQVKKWLEKYQELSVEVTDETGRTRTGRIFGILKTGGQMVCMDKAQMEEIFQGSSKIMGGYMEVYGLRNMEQAKAALEQGGILVGE